MDSLKEKTKRLNNLILSSSNKCKCGVIEEMFDLIYDIMEEIDEKEKNQKKLDYDVHLT